ncbi:hypothetical protein BSKO_12001 [Bryopsis sp. KO-2023]|nr:hypothetical protein BSKO_12001 [Bryopsis sp. KO-2023]
MSRALFDRRKKLPTTTSSILICIVACFVVLYLAASFKSPRTECSGRKLREEWRYSAKNPQLHVPTDKVALAAVELNNASLSAPGPKLAEFYGLTRDQLWRMAPDGYLHITSANFHYLDWTLNWVNHITEAGITSFIVGCMDERILLELNARGVPTVDMHMGVSTNDLGWGSKDFYRSGEEMVRLNLAVLQFGITVIVQDIDTVWLRDPMEFWERYPRADLFCSSDHYFSTTKDDGLEDSSKVGTVANTGLYVLRPSALNFTKEWLETLATDKLGWEQSTFWDVYLQGYRHLPDDPDRLFEVYRGKLLMGLLPNAVFTSGHIYFVQHLPKKMGYDPYLVHATFQYYGVTGKRHRMRDAFLWTVDPPEYYDTPGGYLAWDFDVPADLLARSPAKNLTSMELDDVLGHLDLINHQLTQIRNALSIAKALNRTLIFNEIWCGQDRWWNPHTGLLPTVEMELPFVCPLDYILEVSLMKPEQKADFDPELEPYIDFRESSFLQNERLPKSVLESELRVEVCDSDDCPTQKDSTSSKRATVHIPPNLTDVELKAALPNLDSHKLLRFSSMRNTFRGFQDPEEGAAFEKKIMYWAALWCCVLPVDDLPGHVWLDLFHDVLPHTDRHGRVWNETHKWVAVQGPD